MHLQNIHKIVVKRLFIGWVLLSLVIGGAVYYFELKKVDKLVLGLAMAESRFFTVQLDRNSASRTELLKQKADEFIKRHFIVIELYDENRKLILRDIRPGKEAIDKGIEQTIQAFPLENAVHYNQFMMDRSSFLHVMLPLHDNGGELIGYFKGIYQVDAETLHNIETNIAGSWLLVIVVILITAIMLYPVIISLNKGLVKLSSELLGGNIELMDVLGSAIAKRDSDTNSHNYRVTIYAIRFAEILGLSSEKIRKLIAGAFLHDVGKIGIRDNILLKPSSLTDEEFTVMRTHVLIGVDIISRSRWLEGATEVVEFHHEKFDGSGYMQGLHGNEIPLNARIFTIVDVFDALTSKRPYKEPFDFDATIKLMKPDSGKRFDPELFRIFNERASNLYQEIAHASDAVLESMLGTLIRKHFFTENS
jgi:HD-GYP domain-containing protein (c-di-GMP phosphodiesterase class II)